MKKKLSIIAIIALILYVGTASFSLVKTGERSTVSYPLSKELKERIVNETHELDEIDIVNYSLKLTDELLEFDETNNINGGKANCVGYAQLFTSICNYYLEAGGYDGRVKPVVGNIKWCGINLCEVLKAIVPKKYESFVKDHDFIELEYEDKYVYIDPTLYVFCGRTGKTECPKK